MEVVARDIYVGRQPILDRQGQLFAYEVLFRSGASGGAVISDDLTATASVIEHVFFDLGLEAALGPYPGFVNLDARMLLSDAIEVLPPEKFVLEILETTQVTPEIVARAKELKHKGYRIALDDFVRFDEQQRPLLELADIVKVDLLQLGNGELRELTATLKRWPARLLAEKVDSEDQARHYRELGYELFQGYYFARPVVIAGKKLSHSETTLLRLAATRGRLMELLAESLPKGGRDLQDYAFMTGILSLMPSLSMERVSASLTQALAWANAIGEA